MWSIALLSTFTAILMTHRFIITLNLLLFSHLRSSWPACWISDFVCTQIVFNQIKRKSMHCLLAQILQVFRLYSTLYSACEIIHSDSQSWGSFWFLTNLSSHLYDCNAPYVGFPSKIMQPLQYVQDSARTHNTKSAQITPMFYRLTYHWLPTPLCIQFKLLLLTYESLDGQVYPKPNTHFCSGSSPYVQSRHDRWNINLTASKL